MDAFVEVPIRCPNCRSGLETVLQQLIDLGKEPQLRRALVQATIHQRTCPQCGALVAVPVPMAAWDPVNQRVIMRVPEELSGQEGAVIRARQLAHSLLELLPAADRQAVRESVLPSSYGEYVDLLLEGFLDRPEEAGLRAEGAWQELYQRLGRDDRRELLTLLHECGGENNPTFLKALSQRHRLNAAIRRALDPDEKLYSRELEHLIREVTYPDVAPPPARRVQLAARVIHMCGANVELRSITEGMRLAILEELKTAAALDRTTGRALLDVAMEELKDDSHRAERAILLHDYGSCLANQEDGNDNQAREEAIGLYLRAIATLGDDLLPDLVGEANKNLAQILLSRKAGDPAENLALAKERLQDALARFEDAGLVKRQVEVNRLLADLCVRLQTEDPADSQDRAIAHLHAALHLPNGFPNLAEIRSVLSELVGLYMCRVNGPRRHNLELAIQLCELAFSEPYRADDPRDQWDTHVNLAQLLIEREGEDMSADLERAIWHATEAANLVRNDDNKRALASALVTAALAYKKRIRGNAEENLEEAIYLYEAAIALDESESGPFGSWHYNLGNAYRARKHGTRQENLALARTHHEQAMACRPFATQPVLWARSHYSLGNICRETAELSSPPNRALLNEAEAHYLDAQRVFSPARLPRDWAMSMYGLSDVWAARRKLDVPESQAQALAALYRALEVFTPQAYPRDAETVWRQIGTHTFFARDWSTALDAYESAITIREQLFSESYSRAGRLKELSGLGPLAARRAYCLARLQRFGEAVAAIEQVRARLLSTAIGLRDESLSPSSDQPAAHLVAARNDVLALEAEEQEQEQGRLGRPLWQIHAELKEARVRLEEARQNLTHASAPPAQQPDDLSMILSVPGEAEVLCLPLFTEMGSLIFLLPANLQQVGPEHVVWLDHFTLPDLRGLLGSRPYSGDRPGWFDVLMHFRTGDLDKEEAVFPIMEDVTDRLRTTVITPLLPRLRQWGCRRVLLIPQGGSQLLPWHAALWSNSAAAPEWEVCYLPTARLEHPVAPVIGSANSQSIAIVVDPTEDLRYAFLEAKMLSQFLDLPRQEAILGPAATCAATSKLLATSDWFHFAGHAMASLADPWENCLLCADGRLTVETIRRMTGGQGLQLVVLSACESGVQEVHQWPEEWFGLPTAFMMAGARSVLSTLWVVDDLSTALLMREFYRRMAQGADDVAALTGAQQWLASATAVELGLADLYRQAFDRSGGADRAAARSAIYFERHPNEKAFANLYYWAPFVIHRLAGTHHTESPPEGGVTDSKRTGG